MKLLRERVKRMAPSADVIFINGSCDDCVEQILRTIPRGSASRSVLSLCLVDPFDFGFKFETLKRLSDVFMDFMVLLAAQMDANRNLEHYMADGNTKIANALGKNDWRQPWEKSNLQRSRFPVFLAEEFAQSMTTLGYLPRKVHDMKRIKTCYNNMALYYIALFSKHQRAYEFWKDVMKYGNDQRTLWD
jgi:three-Cys-motif partner protein